MSSKRRIRKRSCESKIRYTDVDKAYGHARSLGWPWHPYKCKFCKGYHVGRYSEKTIKSMGKKR